MNQKIPVTINIINMIYMIDDVKILRASFIMELARGVLLTQWSYNTM